MVSFARLRVILALALPIVGGMVSQNVLNLVDTLMVGALGDVALAAVGQASFVQFMCTGFITGISAGVQAIAARRIGENRSDEAATPLNGGLLIAAGVGVPLSVVLILTAPSFFPLIAGDADVSRVGVPYLQVRLTAVAALAMNFSFRGYWNGVSKAHVYFRTIVVMHVLNVALNYLLIFGKFGFPEMGTTGAGAASAISFWVGTILYFSQALRLARNKGFLSGIPGKKDLVGMLKLSVPTGIQQTFFAAGMTAFFAIINRVGTREAAASNVLVNLLLVVILPSMAFGMASATLVSQSLGRREPVAARGWGGDVVKVAFVSMAAIGAIGVLFPRLLLAPFLHDPVTLEMAVVPLRLIGATLPIDAIGLVLLQSLIGAGHTRRVMWITIGLQWGVQLPLVFLVGVVLHGGLPLIWGMHIVYRAVLTAVLAIEWRRGTWSEIEI